MGKVNANSSRNIKLMILLSFMFLLLTPSKTLASDYVVSNGIITEYLGNETEITIPETIDGITITGIGKNAFFPYKEPLSQDRIDRLSAITKITIPKTVEYIDEQAFYCLGRLNQITIQNETVIENGVETIKGVKEIAYFAFNTCPSLTTLTIPQSVKTIGSGAFAECESLSEIKIEEGAKTIGSKAFNYAISLTKVELPESIEEIADDTFNDAATNFTIIAPQYKTKNTGELIETKASKLAKKLETESSVTYEPTNYGITIIQPEGGTITLNKNVATPGDTITINLTENIGYEKQKITYTPDGGVETEITGTEITMPSNNITITATLLKQTYTITSSAGENGTIQPLGTTEVLKNGTQTYTITPNPGYTIDKITIDGEEQQDIVSTYTINNITKNQTIEVTFRQLETYTLTQNISNIIETTIEKQETKNITTKTASTNFLAWVTNGIGPQNTKQINFLMPRQNVEITYTYAEPNYNTTTLETTPTISNGVSSTTVDQAELTSQIAITESDTIEIKIEELGNESEVKVTIPKTNITEITNKANIEQLKIQTAVGTLSIQKDALQTIQSQASGSNITISIKECEESELTEIQKELVGERPVYKFQIESNGTPISEFNGTIVVTVPYTLKSGENQNGITVYYIDGNGTTEAMKTIYKNGTVSFTTRHFSEYFIRNIIEEQEEQEANRPEEPKEDEEEPIIPEDPKEDEQPKEDKPSKKNNKKNKTETKEEEQPIEEIKPTEEESEIELNFTDVKQDGWYYEAIKYAVKNKIASGTSKTTFSPNDPITRGQAITMLCKTYNIQEETTGENFIDAGDTYYTNYILALKNKNLISGTGNNKVEPKKEITREELMVMLYKIIEYTNNIIPEETTEQETVPTYQDENEISIWSKEAVNYFIQNKIIVGNNGKINPKGKTTRAEMVQIIYKLNKEK